MKTTLGWLKTHLATSASLDEIARTLVMLGLEVEGVEDRAKDLQPFTVARVISAEPHPQADRLKVCQVETSQGQVQVVCGAPNARTGMLGVFAPVGTVIPRTGMLLKETTIRGVASRGMLCSEYEMGLSEEHEGIIDLPPSAKVGEPAVLRATLRLREGCRTLKSYNNRVIKLSAEDDGVAFDRAMVPATLQDDALVFVIGLRATKPGKHPINGLFRVGYIHGTDEMSMVSLRLIASVTGTE
jgi:tRNA-binding EMAP/Myf-like protein